MAKTRRKRINRSPKGNQNSTLAVVEKGVLVRTNGFRTEGGEARAGADARPVFVGRTYTGVARGKGRRAGEGYRLAPGGGSAVSRWVIGPGPTGERGR